MQLPILDLTPLGAMAVPATSTKRVILWTSPRCLSTAFLRSIATLSKAQVFHELFSTVHYHGPDAAAKRGAKNGGAADNADVAEKLPFEPTFDAVTKILKADYPGKEVVFSKEMAYCVDGQFERLVAEGIVGPDSDFVHSILIRSADRAVYSLYKASVNEGLTGWSEFDPSEAGFRQLYELYVFLKERCGVAPVVIDATDLQAAPDETMKRYCEAVGIGYEEGMTSWEPGPIPGSIWDGWHQVAEMSSGIIKSDASRQKPVPMDELPVEVVRCIEESRRYYEALREARVVA